MAFHEVRLTDRRQSTCKLCLMMSLHILSFSAQPLHWNYNIDKLNGIIGDKKDIAFWEPSANPFYCRPTGSHSCYGDQSFVILKSLVDNDGITTYIFTALPLPFTWYLYFNLIKFRFPHSLPFLFVFFLWLRFGRSKDNWSEFMSGVNYFPSERFRGLSKHYARWIAIAPVKHCWLGIVNLTSDMNSDGCP